MGSWMDNDSSKFIQQQKFLMEDVASIKDKLDSQDDKLLTLISQNAEIMRYLENLDSKKTSQREKLKARKKPKPATKKGSDTDWAHLLHLPTALQRNITKFIQDLSFKPSEIPDRLVEEGCLGESECEIICAKTSQADQVRLLIKKLKGRGPETIQSFLDIINEDKAYEHLVTAVYDTLAKIIAQNKDRPMCAYCVIRKTVDLKDIADHLWENGVICDAVYGSVIETEGPANEQYLWSIVIHYINTAKDPCTAKQVLEDSLKQKYNHLLKPLAEHLPVQVCRDKGRLLSCTCRARRSLMQRHTSAESQSDLSLCSEDLHKIPKFYLFESPNNSESENYTSLESGEQLGGSLTSLNFRNLRQLDDDKAVSPDTTTSDCNVLFQATEERQKSRHSSGQFQPQDNEQLESGQFGSLSYVNSEDIASVEGNNKALAVGDKPDFVRNLSTGTVIAAQNGNNPAADGDLKTSDSNTTISPDPEKYTNLSLNTSDVMTGPSSASPNQENKLPSSPFKKFSPRRSQAYRQACKSNASSSDNEEVHDNNNVAFKRTRHRNHRHRYLARQGSEPHGWILTKPRPQTDSTVGVRTITSAGKKSSVKRAERRKRNEDKTENASQPMMSINRTRSMPVGLGDETYSHIIPYNPSWGHRVQMRTRSQWDYNQARRFWRMSHLTAVSNGNMSDSELRTEESDSLAYTDDNTV